MFYLVKPKTQVKTNYKTALILSFAVSLLLNAIFVVSFFYGKEMPTTGSRHFLPSFDSNVVIVQFLANFVLAFILYIINFNILKLKIQFKAQLLTIVLTTAVLTFFLSSFLSEIQIEFTQPRSVDIKEISRYSGAERLERPERERSENFERPERTERRIIGLKRGWLTRDYVIALVVLLSTQLIFLSQKQQKTRLENEALHSEYMRSRYEALKSQVDPHFLFNSLNTLNSLIKVDSDKAQEYVQQLSYVFRYTLQNKEIIPLIEEINYTKAYCHLMQIRYGNNLNFEFNIDESFYDYLIIPLSLQTLVENAIKHNVVSNRQPLTVKIEEENESIRVSNPIQLKKEKESGEGIGLINLAERYRLMWKKEIVTNKSDDKFEVIVPLTKA